MAHHGFVMYEMEAGKSLFRADDMFGQMGVTANQIYTRERPTYFAINRVSMDAYAKHYTYRDQTAFIKEFVVRAPLNLVDMNHSRSYERLMELRPEHAAAIRAAFRLSPAGNHVWRTSDSETKHLEDEALRVICSFDGVDGYFTREQMSINNVSNNGNPGAFHAEIGLCSRAFSKLQLVEQTRAVPTGVPVRRRRPAAVPVAEDAVPVGDVPDPIPAVFRQRLFSGMNNNNRGGNAQSLKRRRNNSSTQGRAMRPRLNSNNRSRRRATRRATRRYANRR